MTHTDDKVDMRQAADAAESARRLAERVEQLESDLSFLARHVPLSERGHATTTEYGRAHAIGNRYDRFTGNRIDGRTA